jgi:uncharacterized protein YkwD
MLSFLGSLLVSAKLGYVIGKLVEERWLWMTGWGDVLGLLMVGVVSEVAFAEIVVWIFQKIKAGKWKFFSNKLVGSVVSLCLTGVILTYLCLVLYAIPDLSGLKKNLTDSYLGREIVQVGEVVSGKKLIFTNKVLGSNAISFLTVKSGSQEKTTLPKFKESCVGEFDYISEKKMVEMVNLERVKRNKSIVSINNNLSEVAREYSLDMASRGYFSHLNPEGFDVADRLKSYDINFVIAGENLAFARDMVTAHKGLLDSVSHRNNILETRFNQLGIGIVNLGSCGVVVTQIFTN